MHSFEMTSGAFFITTSQDKLVVTLFFAVLAKQRCVEWRGRREKLLTYVKIIVHFPANCKENQSLS